MLPRTVRRLIGVCSLQTARPGHSGICAARWTDARFFFLPLAGYSRRSRLWCVGGRNWVACVCKATVGGSFAAATLKVKSYRFRPRNGKKWIGGNWKRRPGLPGSRCSAKPSGYLACWEGRHPCCRHMTACAF